MMMMIVIIIIENLCSVYVIKTYSAGTSSLFLSPYLMILVVIVSIMKN